jgi:membrane-anchored protein YejM (alkaline phosphatase superfamily)
MDELKSFKHSGELFFLDVEFSLPYKTILSAKGLYDNRQRRGVWKKDIKLLSSADKQLRYLHDCSIDLSGLQYVHSNHKNQSLLHSQAMKDYSTAITTVDRQLDRLFDVLDAYDMWHNLTVIVMSNYGMLNGEKGIW